MAYLNASQNASPTPLVPARPQPGALMSKAKPLVQHPRLWGLGLGSFALGLVNGAFVISLGVGWVAYKQLQSLTPRQWAVLRQQIEKALPLPQSLGQRSLVLSMLLAASTYTMTALWQATHSPLMAVVLTGQTTLTFFVVGVLLRSGSTAPQLHKASLRRRQSRPGTSVQIAAQAPPDPVEQSLEQLTHPDALLRLVAVRRLVKRVGATGNDALYATGPQVTLRSHLLDCFHIMLAQETEPIVRTAVREGLELLRQPHQLPEGPPSLPREKPLHSQSHHQNSQADQDNGTPCHHQRHRPVEYVEYLEA